MRWMLAILIGGAMAGCASKPSAVVETRYKPAVSNALVFSPPVAMSESKIDLPREPRERTAFAGYEELQTTYSYLRIDDRQLIYGHHRDDRFERQAISERVGVSYR